MARLMMPRCVGTDYSITRSSDSMLTITLQATRKYYEKGFIFSGLICSLFLFVVLVCFLVFVLGFAFSTGVAVSVVGPVLMCCTVGLLCAGLAAGDKKGFKFQLILDKGLNKLTIEPDQYSPLVMDHPPKPSTHSLDKVNFRLLSPEEKSFFNFGAARWWLRNAWVITWGVCVDGSRDELVAFPLLASENAQLVKSLMSSMEQFLGNEMS